MKKIITVIEGDGIGPEVTQQALKVLKAIATRFQHTFEYIPALMGAIAIDQTGSPLPEDTLNACKASDAVLFGAIGDPKYDNNPQAKIRPEQGLLKIRKELDLFANIRPISYYPTLSHLSPIKLTTHTSIDFVIYRELIGGIYFGHKETDTATQWAKDECFYTRTAIERIAHVAFKDAQKRRKKMTLVDKANVLDTSRLWRLVIKEIALQYPDVAIDYMFVDNAAMQIILNPAQFDVILTENMFGDIISDEASVISGSLGLLPSASVGPHIALFEPIHGSYPQATGKDIANPIGSILSAAMLLDYFSLKQEATCVKEGVQWLISNLFVTKDIDSINYYGTQTIGTMMEEYILKYTGKKQHEHTANTII